jgi:8-oxo-dGTP pyrophosphatase MutT (NUDIX family)
VARKPSIFVGSTRAAKETALSLRDHLREQCEVTHWGHDISALTPAAFESLLSLASSEIDFAVLVCDGKLPPRSRAFEAVRDRIIFQAGLFTGSLGKNRVFLALPSGLDLKLPPDLAGVAVRKYPASARGDANGKAVAPLAGRIAQHVKRHGIRKTGRRDTDFVAALCYRRAADEVEYLLIQTTRGRWVFPKGIVLSQESPQLAALRYAEDEGGVVGRIEIPQGMRFNYLKEERGKEQQILCHLIAVSQTTQVSEAFRNPTWFRLEEAKVAVTQGRSAKYADELRRVLDWAASRIESRNGSTVRLSGVLAYRKNGEGMRFLLVTSKRTGNWVIPKGHKNPRETLSQTATREALEEAGVEGDVKSKVIGTYSYRRDSSDFEVDVYALRVRTEHGDWEEKHARSRKWFGRKEAASAVNERGLKSIIENFSS